MSTDDRGPRERAYDDHISPLMEQIIALCKEHDISLLASFAIGDPDAEDPTLCCTTSIPHKDGKLGERFAEALAIVRPPRPSWAAFTITTSPRR